jgi:hypothetical protein
MARVTCETFFTLRMRRRISRKVAKMPLHQDRLAFNHHPG